MAISTINIGSAPNDGTGDPLRTAFQKTNTNFLNITADGGDEITVTDPTTSTDATLNDALQNVFDAGGGGATQNFQEVTDEGNETTNNVIFRLDANNYIELDTANQTFKFYSDVFGSLDPTEVLTNIDAGGAIFKNLANTAEFVGIGQGVISIKDTTSGNFVVLSKDKLAMYDDSNTLIGEYAYPTGATSQIATLLDLAGKQDTLVSGTNIKSINGTSVLGSGDISIGGVGATQNARATRLELTGNISLPISVGGSVTVIDFDNTVFNVDPTVFTNNGAGTITCTLAGNYLVTTSIVLESPLASAITKSELGIRKNGTNVICATTDDTPIALGNNIRSLTTSTIINLSANDTLQAVVNLFGASATGQGLRLPALFGTTATQVSNISIERLEVSEFDVDATPTDGSSNAVSSNGVFDALALKANLDRVEQYVISKPVGSYGSVTGTVAETVILSIPFSGGDFEIGDYMGFNIWATKVGNAAATTFTVRVGTTGTTADSILCLLGGQPIGQNTYSATRFYLQFESGNFINNRTRVSTGVNIDITSAVSATRPSLNPSASWFLTFTATNASALDVTNISAYQVTKRKSF